MEQSAEHGATAAASNESELISLARAGDDFAWRRLVGAHQQSVFRLALLITGNPTDAEDVAQETFVRTCHHLDRFDENRPMRPWLLRITGRLARNRCRERGRYLGFLARWQAAESQPQWVEDKNPPESAKLMQAIRQLPIASQHIVYLRYFLELSEAEAAVTLGIRLGTVKSRTARAITKLAAIVSAEFPELVPEASDNG